MLLKKMFVKNKNDNVTKKDYILSGKMESDYFWLFDKFAHNFLPTSLTITCDDGYSFSVPFCYDSRVEFKFVSIAKEVTAAMIKEMEVHNKEMNQTRKENRLKMK